MPTKLFYIEMFPVEFYGYLSQDIALYVRATFPKGMGVKNRIQNNNNKSPWYKSVRKPGFSTIKQISFLQGVYVP